MNLKVLIYFSVLSFERSFINAPEPCVLFATPGIQAMGSGRNQCYYASRVLCRWNHRPHQIHQLSFSPHTDAKGIMDLVGLLSPQHVILVHGEKPKMALLKGRIQTELGIRCYDPANNETVSIPTDRTVKTDATKAFIKSYSATNFDVSSTRSVGFTDSNRKDIEILPIVGERKAAEGILLMDKTKRAKIVCENELLLNLGVEEHSLRLGYCFPVHVDCLKQTSHLSTSGSSIGFEKGNSSPAAATSPECQAERSTCILGKCSLLTTLLRRLESQIWCKNIEENPNYLKLNSIKIHSCSKNTCPYRIKDENGGRSALYFCCSWSPVDQDLASKLISIIKCSNTSLVQDTCTMELEMPKN